MTGERPELSVTSVPRHPSLVTNKQQATLDTLTLSQSSLCRPLTEDQMMRLSTLLPVLCLQLSRSAPGSDYKEEVGRIVNGEEAPEGALPYQASLQINLGTRLVSSKPAHFCGGAFISKNWVVTASHCVKGQNARGLKIVGGTNDITDEQSPTFAVSEVIMSDYNDITKVNDIALLKLNTTTYDLERRTEEGHPTRPVSLCPESFQPQGRNCTVSGWGHLKSKGSAVPPKLREVEVLVLHTEICSKMLEGYPWDRKTNTMLCAGGEDKDACQGDSGGPLVCVEDSGTSCLAGVVSWGVGCATEGIPGVYTNVRKYNGWIRQKIQQSL